jgi:16S rRNA (guanine527-N7)-methyltransferase
MTYSITQNVSRETQDKLRAYHELLLQWQERINLIANVENAWERHFIDSAQLIDLFRTRNCQLLDMGSGAGFPGLVLAILGIEDVHLVESDLRKTLFLKEAARITNTKVTIHNRRVESLPKLNADVVTARAMADLDMLLNYAYPHMKKDAFCIFPKGKNWSIELEVARRSWSFDVQTTSSITSDDSALLRIQNVKPAG